jgi:hypothetical protein
MGVREMRHLPDFAAIWRNRPRDEKAKIHDEHLGAAEANVDGLVEAVGDISRRKDYRTGPPPKAVKGWVIFAAFVPPAGSSGGKGISV